jgi:hypothetical protein
LLQAEEQAGSLEIAEGYSLKHEIIVAKFKGLTGHFGVWRPCCEGEKGGWKPESVLPGAGGRNSRLSATNFKDLRYYTFKREK